MKSKLIIKLIEKVFPKEYGQIRGEGFQNGITVAFPLGREVGGIEANLHGIILGRKDVEDLKGQDLKPLVMKELPEEDMIPELKKMWEQIAFLKRGTGY